MSPKKIEFNNGETVVYPKHGVGEIVKIESMEIASIKTMFYVVKMEQSKLSPKLLKAKIQLNQTFQLQLIRIFINKLYLNKD